VSDSRKGSVDNIAELAKASQAGQRGAFDQLVRLYQRRAMRAAVGILGDVNEAAEAVQVGFVNAYLNIGKLKEPERFEPWLLRIVTNAAISQVRAAKRRHEKLKPAGDCAGNNSNTGIVGESADELKEVIRQAMAKLSKKEAAAISLFGLEGMSHKGVAEIMNCSVEAVRWHVFNARKKLKVLLKEYLE